MPVVLNEKMTKARKPHRCDYCGETIEKGEIYNIAALIQDGEIYKWKEHSKCHYIAQRLWKYIGPEEGLGEDGFKDGCANFCGNFICPHCDQMVSETEECTEDHSYCLDKIYDFLQTHTLKRADNWFRTWVAEEIKDSEK